MMDEQEIWFDTLRMVVNHPATKNPETGGPMTLGLAVEAANCVVDEFRKKFAQITRGEGEV